MKVFFNGFWSGFHDHTNAVHDVFFTKLMKEIYDTNIEVTHDMTDADILIENTQIAQTYRHTKEWKHTYLFSGESYIRSDKDDYSCVLFGNRNHKNVVNVPLYLPYYVCSFDESYITENKKPIITTTPPKDILVMVSNPGGEIRNRFMEELEKHFNVTYAGHYKNNTGQPLPYYYNSPECRDYVSQFKFVLSMENSEEDTYITEKITHGFLSGSIPVYWGSKRVTDYMNADRFLEVTSFSDFDKVINTMKTMTNEEWLRRVNLDPFTEFGRNYTLKTVANHVKNVVFPTPFPNLTSLYMICNPEYEPARYDRLLTMCNKLNIPPHSRQFICPTFKHTLTDDIMRKYVTTDRIFRLRATPMRKSEISLFLNFKAVWEDIMKTYRDGIFLILEADAFALPEIQSFHHCLAKLKNKEWSGINISGCNGRISNFNPKESYVPDFQYRLPFTEEYRTVLETNCVEDLSTPQDKDVRFMRRYHTRCTDSQLWSYQGCCQMLEEMNKNPNFDIPFDYYISSIFERNMGIKYYWSDDTYFNQSSTSGLDASTIQHDIT
jgi:hypothetical protein